MIHHDFPGPFRDLLPFWSDMLGWQVVGIGSETSSGCSDVPWIGCRTPRQPAAATSPCTNPMPGKVRQGEVGARVLLDLKARNYVPDVILADPGAGETLRVKEVFPDARLVHYCAGHTDRSPRDAAPDLSVIARCDAGISPGWWQKCTYPRDFQPRIDVIRDGIRHAAFGPDRSSVVVTDDGTVLHTGDAVITHFASAQAGGSSLSGFLRVLGPLQRRHPCHALIVGAGADANDWIEQRMAAACVDPQRTHFVNHPRPGRIADMLRVSSVHIHMGRPDRLDRSLLEAMACGCALVVADALPVREVLRHGINALLIDPHDSEGFVEAALRLLGGPLLQASLRREARAEIVRSFDAGAAAIRYARVFDGQPDDHVPLHFLPVALAGDGVALHDYAFCALGAP
ncbi:MAG TPA: glycosyltransferase [Methyloversatilis sp.]